MSWTRPADLRAQLQRLWDRGEILASLVTAESPFPRRLVLKRPTAAELPDRFDEVRAWIAELRGLRHCRVEMREVGHRVLGTNALPHEVWIDTVDDALAFVGRQREAARFAKLVERTRSSQPRLLAWLARRPLRALELAGEWTRLLDIVAWLAANPRPDIYLRQVDLPGVHTKLIERHRGVLTELLDGVLPPGAIDQGASGVAQFARRYGFRDKPERIRFRILDPRHALLPGGGIQDITLDAPSFAGLECGCSRVLVTENEINFLALPPMRDTLVIFGAGYGFDTLGRTGWLAGRQMHYWGDIDTHGFAILDQLRAEFAEVESFLMDRATLMAFEPYWGVEQRPTGRDLPRLTPAESALYDDLRDNRIRKNLRLEQERIGFGWVEAALARLEKR
jgi:hypothetical protein